jgi:putative transposase
MALSGPGERDEEDPIHRRADGGDLSRGGRQGRPRVAKKHGVSAQTIYAWRKHYGTLEPADVKRLRQLESGNGRLKKMVADRDLEIDVLKEITGKKW